jgi:hypothetical protein
MQSAAGFLCGTWHVYDVYVGRGCCSARTSNLLTRAGVKDEDEDLERYFEIIDAKTGAPVDGMTYMLSSNGQSLLSGAMLAGGKTRAFSLKEHPNLAFVSWREGDVR